LQNDVRGRYGPHPQPEKWETDRDFVPRIDGVPMGNRDNMRLFQLSFAFTEILPLYPAPSE